MARCGWLAAAPAPIRSPSRSRAGRSSSPACGRRPSGRRPKMRWQLDHGPQGAARFHQPVTYLVERLTGEAVIDHGLASTTLAYDLGAGDFADDLLAMFGLDRRLLP